MTNEISKKQMVICLRNGLEVYVDIEIGEDLSNDLVEGKIKGFIKISGRTLNTADISGVVLPEDMIDLTKRKNGNWKCPQGYWHSKGEKCDCIDKEQKQKVIKQSEAIVKCGKCQNGYIYKDNLAIICDCIKDL